MDTSACIPDARLPELLNDTTARPDDLAHVRTCARCAERVAGMRRVIGLAEKFRGRVPPEVVARFQAKVHEAMERGGASAAASSNVDALFSTLSGSAPPSSSGPAGGGFAAAAAPTTPAPFDPPEPPRPATQSRGSRRDDAIEHISMPSSAAEAANVPAPYDADAGSGVLERLGLEGRKLLALVLVLLAMAMGIAFLLRRHG